MLLAPIPISLSLSLLTHSSIQLSEIIYDILACEPFNCPRPEKVGHEFYNGEYEAWKIKLIEQEKHDVKVAQDVRDGVFSIQYCIVCAAVTCICLT